MLFALTRTNGLLPQLHKGKYVRDHSQLEVQPTGRYFLNIMLGESVPAGIAWELGVCRSCCRARTVYVAEAG